MYELPVSVTLKDGTELKIRKGGDFRIVIKTILALIDEELNETQRAHTALRIFFQDSLEIPFEQYEDALEQLCWFIGCGEEQDNSGTKPLQLINWETDSSIICAGVNKVLGKDIRAESYLHWFSFISAYMEIGESSLATVVGIRKKIKTGKKLDDWEKTFKREHPNYFIDKKTQQDVEEEDYWRSKFNS